MIEYSKLPKSVRKIIAWHRFPHRSEVLDLNAYNTREIDLAAAEGYYAEGTRRMLVAVHEEIEKNPNAVLVIYANFNHIPVAVKPFLEQIPKEKIKRIHLFEDGYGELFKWGKEYIENKNFYDPDLDKKTLQALIDNKIKWEVYHSFGLRWHYPITYHFLHAQEMDTVAHLKKFRKSLKDADIRTINFDKLRKTLSNEQKDIIYRLSGFDYPKYNKLMRGKKTFMFVLGYHFGNKDRLKAEEKLLQSLYNGTSTY